MNIIFCSIAIIICLVLIALHLYRVYKRRVTSMSFKEAMALAELPVVTFTCKGKPVNFILDTGANNSVIHESIAKKLKLEPNGKKAKITGMNSSLDNVDIADIELVHNNRKYKDNVQIVDLGAVLKQIKRTTGVTAHGIIGSGFFANNKYVLDFKDMIAYSRK